MTTQAGQVATDPKAERRCSSAFCSHVFSVTPTPPPAHHRDRKGASELAARCGPGRPACGNAITDTLSGATRNTLLRNLIGATPRCGGIAQRRAGGDVHRRPSGHQRSPRQNAHHEQPQLVLRCTAADMLNAERSFRRIKGHSQIPLLVEALHRHAIPKPLGTPNLLAPPPASTGSGCSEASGCGEACRRASDRPVASMPMTSSTPAVLVRRTTSTSRFLLVTLFVSIADSSLVAPSAR